MKIFFLLLILLITSYQGVQLWLRFDVENKKIRAEEELARIQRATMEAFHEKTPPTEKEFWKEMGKEVALNDPWNNAYRLFNKGDHLLWVSSGPDKILGTQDDISKILLVRDGIVLYLQNKSQSEPNSGMRVMEAK